MTDQTEARDRFEESLGRRLLAASDRAIRPFEPAEVARRATVGSTRRPPRPPVALLGSRRFLALAAAALVTAGTIYAATSGGPRLAVTPPSSPLPPALVSVPPSASSHPTASPREATQSPTEITASEAPQTTKSCADLDADVQQAGVTTGGWDAGRRGPAATVSNGLIATGTVDGKEYPFSHNVLLVDPKTSGSTVVTTFKDAYITSLAWSPTGSALAFTAAVDSYGRGGCAGLFVRSSAGIVEVASPVSVDAPLVWSPTGSRLAFAGRGTDGTHHLWIAAADGAQPRDMGSICGKCSYIDPMQMAPDGTRIAVAWITADTSDSRLSIVSLRTGSWSVVPHSSGDRNPLWVDNSTLLVQADEMAPSGHPGYATVAIDQSGAPMSRLSWPPNKPVQLSPDQRWWTNYGCTTCPFTITKRSTGQTVTLATGESNAVAWSPDGQQIAYSIQSDAQRGDGTWVAGLDGTHQRRILASTLDLLDWQPVWP